MQLALCGVFFSILKHICFDYRTKQKKNVNPTQLWKVRTWPFREEWMAVIFRRESPFIYRIQLNTFQMFELNENQRMLYFFPIVLLFFFLRTHSPVIFIYLYMPRSSTTVTHDWSICVHITSLKQQLIKESHAHTQTVINN